MEDGEAVVLFLQIGIFFALLIGTFFIGTWIERRHFASLRERETRWRRMPVMTFSDPPDGWEVADAGLASGSVVISLDYFKRFLAGLRGLVGGRISAYETLLDRARREAVLRMMEHARSQGFEAVVNVRLETSRLASSRGDGRGNAGIEVLAYGTALRRV